MRETSDISPFTDWVVTQDCVLTGLVTTRRLSDNDISPESYTISAADPRFARLSTSEARIQAAIDYASSLPPVIWASRGFLHHCLGDRTPAHVGKHRAKGAADRGHVVCMCQAAHQEYDEHRSRFYRVTHLTELRLEAKAEELAAQYVGLHVARRLRETVLRLGGTV